MTMMKKNKIRLAIFATHPIQYQVPIWRQLALTQDIKSKVFYISDHSIVGGKDEGFGKNIAWDVPLLDGYEYDFIKTGTDVSKLKKVSLDNAKKFLIKEKVDCVLVHGYTNKFTRQVLRAAGKLGIRKIMRGEFADLGKRRNFIKRIIRDTYLRWIYNQVDAFCYIGNEARRHLNRFGVKQSKLFFSPYNTDSISLEKHYQVNTKSSVRARLGIEIDDFVVLFSGKFINRKQPLLLIEAIKRMGVKKDLILLMVGDGPLKKIIEDNGKKVLGKNMILPGFVNQSELGDYYLASDIFVLPSDYDAWGLVVNEAMLFNIPAIVSDGVQCNSDLISNGETGYVFPNGDVQALKVLLESLYNNRNKVVAMGKCARDRIKLYSVECAATGILEAVRGNKVKVV